MFSSRFVGCLEVVREKTDRFSPQKSLLGAEFQAFSSVSAGGCNFKSAAGNRSNDSTLPKKNAPKAE